MADVLSGRCSVADAMTRGPAGMMLLAASGRVRCGGRGIESRRDSLTWAGAQFSRHDHQRLWTELQSIECAFDAVVLDVGSGLTPWTRRFWLQARLVLLVTSTDSSALLDTYALIKSSVADESGPEIRLVVNQCDSHRIAADTEKRFRGACQRFLARQVPAVPSLPRYVHDAGGESWARVWEAPNSAFGHAALWLGRAVEEALSDARCGVDSRVAA
jgi:flagellar biosynthesis protein FlhG